MKRIIALLLAVFTILSSAATMTGCKNENVHIFSRGEWIESIAELYNLTEPYSTEQYFDDVKQGDEYFNAVQACAEWDIIDKGGDFEPNERADVQFAIVTAVKSIGLDKIANSVDGAELTSEKEIIDYFNANSETKYIAGSNLYMDTAKEILADIDRIYNGLVLKQSQSVTYAENVLSITESNVYFSMDGETATLVDIDPALGTVLMLEPCASYPYGKYAKIVTKEGNQITYVQPQLEEIIKELSLVGSYEAKPLGFIPANDMVKVKTIGGVEATANTEYFGKNGEVVQSTYYVQKTSNSNSNYSVVPLDSVNLGNIELELEGEIGSSGASSLSVTGSVALKNIVATADIDMVQVFGIDTPVINKCNIKLDSTLEVSAGFKGEASQTIPLGTIPFTLWGIIGFDVDVELKVGVEGSVSVVYSVDTTAGVDYKILAAPKYTTKAKNASLDLEVATKAYVKPVVKASFVLACFDVANVGIYSGVEVSAKLKVGLDDDVVCTDLNAFVPMTIFVGAEKNETLLGKLGVKYTNAIWDKSSSPVKKSLHVENLEVVSECTQKNKDEEVGENGGSNERDDVFDIPSIDEVISSILQMKNGLTISTHYARLEENQKDKLLVTGLPDGYSVNDIQFLSSDETVAKVDGSGNVQAVASGSCVITVKTNDGLYTQYCAVYVMASYDVEFTPLSCGIGDSEYVTVQT